MDDLDPLLIWKQEPWNVKTPQSVMAIRLISRDERHGITDKFKEFFQEPKRNLTSQFLLICNVIDGSAINTYPPTPHNVVIPPHSEFPGLNLQETSPL